MRQEEKSLLLEDLCSRLPYKTQIQYTIINENGYEVTDLLPEFIIAFQRENDIIIKPYLRPLSSMTEEEKGLLKQEHLKDERLYLDAINGDGSMRGKVITHYAADWCNQYHFDYRGLIENGLALEAPKGMYGKEEQQ